MSSHQWTRRLPSSAVPTGWRERSVKKSKVASIAGPRCFVLCRKADGVIFFMSNKGMADDTWLKALDHK